MGAYCWKAKNLGNYIIMEHAFKYQLEQISIFLPK